MKTFLISSSLPIFPMTKEDSQGNYVLEVQADNVSDGYHTMHELYQHRMALNIGLFHALDELYRRGGLDIFVPKVYKSKNHHPDSDEMFPGYFIVFCVGREGIWTSYHYDLKHWDKFKIRIAQFSPLYPLNHVDSITFFKNLSWRE